jgi:hypothetical protein
VLACLLLAAAGPAGLVKRPIDRGASGPGAAARCECEEREGKNQVVSHYDYSMLSVSLIWRWKEGRLVKMNELQKDCDGSSREGRRVAFQRLGELGQDDKG